MTLDGLLVQLLNGLAGASTLFLVAAGLALIFGVTRIVNFAHGSLYMLGLYVAYSLVTRIGRTPLGFWGAILLAAAAVAVLGALIEVSLLQRIYRAPVLFQLLATFALVLVFKDAALYVWGAEDLLGPRAPGLGGSFEILGRRFPQYDLVLIAIGPVVLGLLWLVLTRTRWGTLVRAATQDREMVGALGVNQTWLFTAVFALGAFIAGLGGALQVPREPANLNLDLVAIGDAFVVVVVGGLGSIPGAYLAALLIAEIKAICVGIGQVSFLGTTLSLSRLTLVVEFLVMAGVLVARPWGLLGRPVSVTRSAAEIEQPIRPAGRWLRNLAWVTLLALLTVPLLGERAPYATVLMVDVLVAALFAASLHFIMGPGAMHSFGHAAYFGLGAYGAALGVKLLSLPFGVALVAGALLALLGALVFGWFSVRLSGVYLAMLTLAFGQLVWSVAYQWDEVTGGSNGVVGVWPPPWLGSKAAFYYVTLALCAGGVLLLRRVLFSPLGYGLRATRDSPLRSDAIGIDVPRVQWAAFALAGLLGGVAGAVFVFAKGGISPEALAVGRSVDGLVMVLLGGIQTLSGPLVGAGVYTWLADAVARQTEYWRAMLGIVMLGMVLLFPQGIAGSLRERFGRRLEP
jgi:branched-chain amino acid transport system permease protein